MGSTNYFDTFIEIAEDCPVNEGTVPPARGDKPTIATLQYDMLTAAPYEHTSDDVLFAVHATRKDLPTDDLEAERAAFLAKDQACFRSSPLTKRYGWGIHSDAGGRIAFYGADTADYRRLAKDPALTHLKAMRSKRA